MPNLQQPSPGEKIIKTFLDAFAHEHTVDIATDIADGYALRVDRTRKQLRRKRLLGTAQTDDYTELGTLVMHSTDATEFMHYTDQLRGKFESRIDRTLQRYAGSTVVARGLGTHIGPVLYRDYTAMIPADYDVVRGTLEGLHSGTTFTPVVSILSETRWGWRRQGPEFSRVWARLLDDEGEPLVDLQIEE